MIRARTISDYFADDVFLGPTMGISGIGESLYSDARRYLQDDCLDGGLRAVCHASLSGRGLDETYLEQLPVGLFASRAAMRNGLLRAGFSAEEIRESGLVGDARLVGRLLGPIRSVQGRLLSLWATDPEGQRPKYLFLTQGWQEQVPAIGLDVAMQEPDDAGHELLLVEDLLDWLLIRSTGFRQVAASLGFARHLDAARWRQLADLGVKEVTLVPGSDGEGLARAVIAREASLQDSPSPEVFVLLPERFGDMKSLAEKLRSIPADQVWPWLKKHQVPRTRELLAHASILGPGQEDVDTTAELAEVRGDIASAPAVSEAPVASESVRRGSRPSGPCPLHGCDPMWCFCWD